MMNSFTGQIIVRDGSLIIDHDNPKDWADHVRSLKGHRIVQTLKKEKTRDKSLKQLGYYFGYVVPTIGTYLELGKDEAHSAIKIEILISQAGLTPKLVYSPSIEDFTTIQMEDYLSRVRAWASRDLGIYLDKPNERGYDFTLTDYNSLPDGNGDKKM